MTASSTDVSNVIDIPVGFSSASGLCPASDWLRRPRPITARDVVFVVTNKRVPQCFNLAFNRQQRCGCSSGTFWPRAEEILHRTR